MANTDREDHDDPYEENPQMARLYDILEGTAQDLKHALKADTVVILITRHDNKTNQTESFGAGLGNHYARIESCREYVSKKSCE